jgi:hypothetical protein
MTPWPGGPPTSCAAPTPRSSSCCAAPWQKPAGCPPTPERCAGRADHRAAPPASAPPQRGGGRRPTPGSPAEHGRCGGRRLVSSGHAASHAPIMSFEEANLFIGSLLIRAVGRGRAAAQRRGRQAAVAAAGAAALATTPPAAPQHAAGGQPGPDRSQRHRPGVPAGWFGADARPAWPPARPSAASSTLCATCVAPYIGLTCWKQLSPDRSMSSSPQARRASRWGTHWAQ